MKRLGTLVAVLVALVAIYAAARFYSQSPSFRAPADFHVSEWKSDQIDHIRLAFAGGKEINLQKNDGKWTANDFPAEPSHIDQTLDYFSKAQITSRASTNPDNHSHFEVDAAKGLTVTLFTKDKEIQQLIMGKTAGGDTVYVRLPDHNDVFVMSGVSRYYFSDELSIWRDHHVVSFDKDRIRQIEYTENQINWKLVNSKDGWTLASKWIGPIALDKDKVGSFVQSIADLQAIDFATKEQVDMARDKQATFARAITEIGTPDTFERRETWSIYTTTQGDRYLLVRDNDNLGFFVSKDAIDSLLSDYADMKTRLIPSPAAPKTEETPAPAVK